MLTTMMTDASWCPQSHVGGWGSWMKNDRLERGSQFSARFKSLMATSTIAELNAATNAMYMAIKCKIVQPNESVLLQLDNLRALNILDGPILPDSDDEKLAKFTMEQLLGAHGISLSLRHVKAHRPSRLSTRYGVNNKCDELAKARMREARVLLAAGIPLDADHEVVAQYLPADAS